MKIKTMFLGARKFVVKNAPTILTIMGSAGLVATTVSAINATPKALDKMERELWDREDESDEPEGIVPDKISDYHHEFTKMEIVKMCWKDYIPTVILGGTSLACIIGSNTINLKRQAALAGMYAMAVNNLETYEAKVKEVFGEKGHDEVMQKVDKENLKHADFDNVEYTSAGGQLFYDSFSGRLFTSSMDRVVRAEAQTNADIINEPFVTVNTFYDHLGIRECQMGRMLGWCLDEAGGTITLRKDAEMINDKAVIVLDWSTDPSLDN